jgi:DNA repair exonuclease SbcCD ATPase subunit
MEELVSTDNIHREILEDAKRKAGKILKSAEASIAAEAERWEAKLQKAVDEIRRHYDAEIAEKKAEAQTRLTMDKMRIRLDKVTRELDKAARAFLASLRREEILDALLHALQKRLENAKAVSGADFTPLSIHVCGLSEAETGALLDRLHLSGAPGAARVEERETAGEFPSVTLSDGGITITASIQAEADAVLLAKRSEAAEALFG